MFKIPWIASFKYDNLGTGIKNCQKCSQIPHSESQGNSLLGCHSSHLKNNNNNKISLQQRGFSVDLRSCASILKLTTTGRGLRQLLCSSGAEELFVGVWAAIPTLPGAWAQVPPVGGTGMCHRCRAMFTGALVHPPWCWILTDHN